VAAYRDEVAGIFEGFTRLVSEPAEVERLRTLFKQKYPCWSELNEPSLPGKVRSHPPEDPELGT